MRDGSKRRAQTGVEFAGLARCSLCGNPVMFVIVASEEEFAHRLAHRHSKQHERLPSEAFAVVQTYPELSQVDAHPSWPEKLQAPFVELQEDVARNRTPGRIIAGCRSILDVATKDLLRKYRPLDPDPEVPKGKRPKEDIFSRVNALADLGLLTGILGQWAHKLRQLGADATHDLEGDPEDARQFVEFLKLFLHVAYELPQAIRDQWPEAPEPNALEELQHIIGSPAARADG